MSRRASNVEVQARPGESVEKLLKRFTKKCKSENIIKEYIDKTLYFKSKKQRRRSKLLKAIWFRNLDENKVNY